MRNIEFLQRDRSTIEVRSYLPISGELASTTQTSFDVYSFIPVSFGAAPQTTSSKEFGKRFQSLYRLHFPSIKLSQLLNYETGQSPLKQLHDILASLPTGLEEDDAIDLGALARFCGAELIEALFREKNKIEDVLVGNAFSEEVAVRLRKLCENCVDAARKLRVMQTKAESFQYILPAGFPDILRVVGEYFSVSATEQLSGLVQSDAFRNNETLSSVERDIGNAVEELMRTYNLLPLSDLREEDKEYLAYRTNRLKKEVQRSLYLEPESNERVELISNSAAMVAAGLAALWATTAQIPLLSGKFGETSSFLFFAAAIGAYILKDRIKEIIRRQLSKRWSPWDKLYHFNLSHLRNFGVGSYTGRVEHTSDWATEDELDPTIREARSQQRSVGEVEDEMENILYHHQQLSIRCSNQRTFQDECGVQQVLRLSLDSLLPRLDDPWREVHAYDPSNRTFTKGEVPRVYHLNLVARLETHNNTEPLVARCRAVVNSLGVVRIESQCFEAQVLDSRRFSA